jgi:hypothetical protein
VGAFAGAYCQFEEPGVLQIMFNMGRFITFSSNKSPWMHPWHLIDGGPVGTDIVGGTIGGFTL